MFDKNNRLRRGIFTLINHKVFDLCITFFIIFSSIVLALDDPLLSPESIYKFTLNIIDISATSIFVLEVILKTIAYGFIINGHNSYLR